MTATLNIGLVAYGIDRTMVMVRVPNERGRWVMTRRCVVEVDCPACKAVTGEPCFSDLRRWMPGQIPNPVPQRRYTAGVHIDRQLAYQNQERKRFPEREAEPHKLHIAAEDMAALEKEPITHEE